VVFDDGGWRHRDESTECRRISVAWPPPVEQDEDAGAESAA